MPLKLNVGLSKKVGLPDYGSLGASCHVEIELEGSLLESDLARFNEHVRRAYVACAQAVNEELSRQHAQPVHGASGDTATNFDQANGNGQAQRRRFGTPRKATHSQVRAIQAIADRQGVDLTNLLKERFATANPGDLSITEASQLIDELKGSANGAGDRR